jgi:hypothetical protein
MFGSRFIRQSFVCFALALLGCGGSAPEADADKATPELGGLAFVPWRIERARRDAELDLYFLGHQEDTSSFRNAPLGNAGVPMIMLRLFPEMFPDIWGGPDAPFSKVGFSPNTLEPWRPLPLGLGFTGAEPAVKVPLGPVEIPVNIQVVQLTCAGCHDGRVAVGDQIKHLVGAPNTTFNQFRGAVLRTVNDPRYTVDNFRAHLASHPLGWIFNFDPTKLVQEELERGIFTSDSLDPVTGLRPADRIVLGLRAKANAGAARYAATIGAFTYNVPNAPDPSADQPGYLDAIAAGIAIVVDPNDHVAFPTVEALQAALPPGPAEIDIMSVWRQADRPFAQWDGSIASLVHRNLAAEFGVVGNPDALSLDNAIRTTRFTEALPAAPYPFDVDAASAARGQVLYDRYCASCHRAGNTRIFTPDEVGTDPNRANIFTPYTANALIHVLRQACTDASACNAPDGTPLTDDQIVKTTGGYMALPLSGIWARAPFLHNGSVPTLYALLTRDRPARFFRGNTAYDQQKVGFVWDQDLPGTTAAYDSTKAGLDNRGHDTPLFLGDVDWTHESRKTADLLEYLKTL